MPIRATNNGGDEVSKQPILTMESSRMYSDEKFLVGKKVLFNDADKRQEEEEEEKDKNLSLTSCSSETSSIGKNSDRSDKSAENDDDEEVESSYKGPLDAMEALEEVLPMRRSISKFYNGKSKSFASLADASSCSIKELAKPENALMRRRRNLLATSIAWDKNRGSQLRSNGGGISKRLTNSSRTTLARAVALRNSEVDKQAGQCSSPVSPVMTPRKDFSSWRSFSVADLEHCVLVQNSCTSSTQ